MRVRHGAFELDDDRARIDRCAIWRFLSEEVTWGRWRTREVVEAQLDASWRVVGAYRDDGEQVAFARAVSDGHGCAYLADVFVLEAQRGGGLGRRLVELLLAGGPEFRWMLHTTDAHEFYRKLGFGPPDAAYLERPSPLRPAAPTSLKV